jgi:hypothetical protein
MMNELTTSTTVRMWVATITNRIIKQIARAKHLDGSFDGMYVSDIVEIHEHPGSSDMSDLFMKEIDAKVIGCSFTGNRKVWADVQKTLSAEELATVVPHDSVSMLLTYKKAATIRR